MTGTTRRWPTVALAALTLGAVLGAMPAAFAQQTTHSGTENGEWRYWGGDAASSRYSPLDQITAENFEDLEIQWVWKGDNYGPTVDNILRSTPIYVNGGLYGVAGQRRTVVSIDPATGETLWTFREPTTKRWELSMRKNYGKGVAYDEVDGDGRIYVVTPAFFLHALDPDTGLPIADFGDGGTVDLLADFGYEYDPYDGIPPEIGYITNSSPPIIVNGTVVVGNAHEQGYHQSRRENVPGHILAYDAATGEHKWKFNVIPQPGEFGHDTWESDAWSYTGNVSAWAPLSADPELGLVYIVTDPPTNDHYGGFHPGDNLFATTILALNAETGERRWHFQTVHHDIWNYDNPTAPNLLDVTIDGERVPILVQTTKQSFAYVLNRETGEPIWPIEERPVPESMIPGEQTSPTQPFPTRPAAYEIQGVTVDDLIDFTPELRQQAIEAMAEYQMGPLFNPPLHRDNDLGKRSALLCPGGNGGTNIPGGTVTDPETGILYTASIKACGAPFLVPGAEADLQYDNPTGTTLMEWASGAGAGPRAIQGLPLLKPPYSRITAIDMNSGDHLWWIPNGDTPNNIQNHRLLEGIDIPNTGNRTHATALLTKSLLIYAEGRGGRPLLYANDKATGERLGTVELPAPTNTALMTYMHEGRQYIILPVGGRGYSGSLIALALP
ncbi:MAG: PQQ-binding-like beta-propeller repeat protein [Vicinamibacterales bacterium]|jgi:quinoprotein glucose dehydrogenase|nr:quinoprotein glucose dehydrogenase [Acidobacteriota bacterium]MDP6373367.1 PQQ-binding-like beta-propeller repeat protein [Vicinamibacterales bacterium]MDP6607552.1 PQQ-binding-like beta-propeller repeat protein [Vicinamibacterales bacterium]|tara:strand:- start:7546 stop:9549 length:2004 start_codon:yes stop_codon:yes gene_type:complete